MRALFLHPNFPAQYVHLSRALAARPGTRVAVIAAEGARVGDEMIHRPYRAPAAPATTIPPRARYVHAALARGEAAAAEAMALRREGFVPDVIMGHIGWGDMIYLKDVFPEAAALLYAEFFYAAQGADVGHEPGQPSTLRDALRVRAMNLPLLSCLHASDWGITPTHWQLSRLPEWYRERVSVAHEGVDTARCAPDPAARFALPDGTLLRPGEEVVSYVARGLEPYRGFPTFMRALPRLLALRPRARVVIVGGDEVRYGRPPRDAPSWREALLREVGPLDPARVHFLGRIPHPDLHDLFRVTAVHVYLTVPFVLSWSTLEAMACGAVVVGSATPTVEEVIQDGRDGLLTDLYDPEALARLLAGVLAEPDRHRRLGEAARETVRSRFDLQTVCLPRQLEVVDHLAARRRPPRFV